MLCASLPESTSAQGIIHHSTFCEELIAQLVSLYSKLPKEMDPADIDSVEAKWGYVCYRNYTACLSWWFWYFAVLVQQGVLFYECFEANIAAMGYFDTILFF